MQTVVEVVKITRLKLSCGHYAMPDHQRVFLNVGDKYECLLCKKPTKKRSA